MHQGQRQRLINEDESHHLAAARPEVFDTVGKPLPTSSNAGANLRELMLRMGHTSPRAAMIYLHSTDARQREIADALGDLASKELKRAKSKPSGATRAKPSGTQRARRRNEAS